MGRCPYIDDSASFMDGYHCKRIGGKVDEYDITRCYCNSSASYEYCPHYPGGDDRLRSKPEPEKPREMVRNSEERESVTERQETHKTTPVRRSSHGEMFKVLMGGGAGFRCAASHYESGRHGKNKRLVPAGKSGDSGPEGFCCGGHFQKSG